jgi:DNA-binding CsgD family transcriptional regulator
MDIPMLERAPLTERERTILGHVAAGMSAKQIAQNVELAPRTVERYIENLRHKLAARNKSHLVAQAISYGELSVRKRK